MQYDIYGNPINQTSSIQQQGTSGNAQNTQNYLAALNQAGAGSNNAFMNTAGQQGQPAQAGFQGMNVPQPSQQQMQPSYGGGFNPYAQQWNPYGQQNMLGAPMPQQPSAIIPQAQQATPQQATTVQNTGSYVAPQSNPQVATNNMQNAAAHFQPTSASPTNLQTSGAQQPGFSGMRTFAMSDVNAKTNIETNDLQDFMNNLNAYSYEYKNKKHGEERYVSPMAQEFEQSKLGKEMVVETPEGKMVDYKNSPGLALACTAILNRRLETLTLQVEKLVKQKLSKKGKIA